jgi:hypothetical protein
MSVPLLRIILTIIMCFSLLFCSKKNEVQNNIISKTDLGKQLINADDYLFVKTLIVSGSKLFNLNDTNLAPNDYVYRIWVLDPFGTKNDPYIYTVRVFQFGRLHEKDTANMFILRFYASEKPTYPVEFTQLSYHPLKGWTNFPKRELEKELFFSETEEFSILEFDGVRTVLFFQQIFRNQIFSYDFSRGYQFYDPNTVLERKFKKLLLFIDSEFGIQLYNFEYGGGFFDKDYCEVTDAD